MFTRADNFEYFSVHITIVMTINNHNFHMTHCRATKCNETAHLTNRSGFKMNFFFSILSRIFHHNKMIQKKFFCPIYKINWYLSKLYNFASDNIPTTIHNIMLSWLRTRVPQRKSGCKNGWINLNQSKTVVRV